MKLKKLLAAVTAAALAVTTMAVTSFTANAASAWSVTDNTATYTAEDKPDPLPDGADQYNAAAPSSDGVIPISTLLPTGKTAADIRSITVDFSNSTGSFGGDVGVNIIKGTPDEAAWGTYEKAEINASGESVIEAPNGLADGQVLKLRYTGLITARLLMQALL